MTSLRPRLTYSNVTSTLALCAALGGGAYAASTIGGGGKIAACYKTSGKSKGLARLVASGTTCRHGERAIGWNQSGPAGDAGAKGATGAAGTNGTAGANGAKGDKGDKGNTGDTGAPGSTIVAKLRGEHVTLGAGLSTPVTMTPGTWSQSAGEGQLMMGAITFTALNGCGGHTVTVSTQLDSLTTIQHVFAPPSVGTFPIRMAAGTDTALAVPLFEPDVGVSHTLTVTVDSTCTDAIEFHPDVDIVSFK